MAPSKIRIWIDAARPKTLAAAFVPVVIGSSLAYHDASFNWLPSLIALICAFLIQIGTNFANDYFDFINGADTKDRIGFERATAQGFVTAEQMKIAMLLTMALAFITGLYLVWHAGWVILALGIASLIFGILYTGGPFPLGYNGLGDLFVFIFFGIVAVMGTYYVNTLQWSASSFWASLAVGALSTNILVVNNLRDVEQDGPAGKKTLGVLFGEAALKWEYVVMLAIAAFIPIYLYLKSGFSLIILLPYISLPLGIYLIISVWTEKEKSNLNKTLEQTAKFMTFFGVLFGLGIMFG